MGQKDRPRRYLVPSELNSLDASHFHVFVDDPLGDGPGVLQFGVAQ